MTRPESDLVSGEELARWPGLSGKEVYDLGKAGVLIRVGRAYRLGTACDVTVNICVGPPRRKKLRHANQGHMSWWKARLGTAANCQKLSWWPCGGNAQVLHHQPTPALT